MINNNILIFDLGWTLEDEQDAQIDRAEKAVKLCDELGINISVEEILDLQNNCGRNGIANVFKSALMKLGLSSSEMETATKNSSWDISKLKLFPDAEFVVKRLSINNDLGIIANQSVSPEGRLKNYGIYDYFKFIVSSCDVGFEKPDPRIFQIAEQKYDINNRNIWMIGDRIDNDIVPAKALGWITVRILQGSHKLQKPMNENETANFTIYSLMELLDIFD